MLVLASDNHERWPRDAGGVGAWCEVIPCVTDRTQLHRAGQAEPCRAGVILMLIYAKVSHNKHMPDQHSLSVPCRRCATLPLLAVDPDIRCILCHNTIRSTPTIWSSLATGPGGYVAAIRAAQLAPVAPPSTANYIGGTCPDPSAAFSVWRCKPNSTERFHEAKSKLSHHGIKSKRISLDPLAYRLPARIRSSSRPPAASAFCSKRTKSIPIKVSGKDSTVSTPRSK